MLSSQVRLGILRDRLSQERRDEEAAAAGGGSDGDEDDGGADEATGRGALSAVPKTRVLKLLAALKPVEEGEDGLDLSVYDRKALLGAVDALELLLRGGILGGVSDRGPGLFQKGPSIASALLGHLGGEGKTLPLGHECKILLLLGFLVGEASVAAQIDAALASAIVEGYARRLGEANAVSSATACDDAAGSSSSSSASSSSSSSSSTCSVLLPHDSRKLRAVLLHCIANINFPDITQVSPALWKRLADATVDAVCNDAGAASLMLGVHGSPPATAGIDSTPNARVTDEVAVRGLNALARMLAIAPRAMSLSSPRWVVQVAFCALHHAREDLRTVASNILGDFDVVRADATMTLPEKGGSASRGGRRRPRAVMQRRLEDSDEALSEALTTAFGAFSKCGTKTMPSPRRNAGATCVPVGSLYLALDACFKDSPLAAIPVWAALFHLVGPGLQKVMSADTVKPDSARGRKAQTMFNTMLNFARVNITRRAAADGRRVLPVREQMLMHWRVVADHFAYCSSKQEGWSRAKYIARYVECFTKPLIHVLKSMNDPSLHAAVFETWLHMLDVLVMQERLTGDALIHVCVPILPMFMVQTSVADGETLRARAKRAVRRVARFGVTASASLESSSSSCSTAGNSPDTLPSLPRADAMLLLILAEADSESHEASANVDSEDAHSLASLIGGFEGRASREAARQRLVQARTAVPAMMATVIKDVQSSHAKHPTNAYYQDIGTSLERIKKSFLASVAAAKDLLHQGDSKEAQEKEDQQRKKEAAEQTRRELARKNDDARELREQAGQAVGQAEEEDKEDVEAMPSEPKVGLDNEVERERAKSHDTDNPIRTDRDSRKRRHAKSTAGAVPSKTNLLPSLPKDGASPSALSANKRANKRQRKASGGVKNLGQDFSKVTNSERRARGRKQKFMTPRQKEKAMRQSTTYTAMDGTQSSQLLDDDSETENDEEENDEEENDTVNDQDGALGRDHIAEEDDDIECYSEDQDGRVAGMHGAVAAAGGRGTVAAAAAAGAAAAGVKADAALRPSTSVFYNRLQELKDMREAELLSQEEYDGFKKEVLNAMMKDVRKPASKRARMPPPSPPPLLPHLPQKEGRAQKKAKLKMLSRMSYSQDEKL